MWTSEKAHALALLDVLQADEEQLEALARQVSRLIHYEVSAEELKRALAFLEKQIPAPTQSDL